MSDDITEHSEFAGEFGGLTFRRMKFKDWAKYAQKMPDSHSQTKSIAMAVAWGQTAEGLLVALAMQKQDDEKTIIDAEFMDEHGGWEEWLAFWEKMCHRPKKAEAAESSGQ